MQYLRISKLQRLLLDKITPCTIIYFHNLCVWAEAMHRVKINTRSTPSISTAAAKMLVDWRLLPKVPNRHNFTSQRSAVFLLPPLVMKTTTWKRWVHSVCNRSNIVPLCVYLLLLLLFFAFLSIVGILQTTVIVMRLKKPMKHLPAPHTVYYSFSGAKNDVPDKSLKRCLKIT